MRPEAAHANLNGIVAYAPRPERGKMNFGYELVRLWERPVEELLAGSPEAAPLAILGQLPVDMELKPGLANVVQRLVQRIESAAPPDQAARLVTASFVLSGLRVPKSVGRVLFKGVDAMRDSTTFMGIIEEGQLAEAKKLLRRWGEKKFGQATEGTIATIDALEAAENLERLETLLERVFEVNTWDELLAD